MKNKEFYKLLKPQKANSGFTLTELLVGLIMGSIVVGSMGFGLMQVLQATQSETSKSAARNEISRALDFISDEMRRARLIENNADNADGEDGGGNLLFDVSGKTVVFALEIPDITNDLDIDSNPATGTIASDNDDTTSERIVYYLRTNSGTDWEGPQVLYRWGPPFDANGNYTEGAWQHEALIDNIDDTVVASPCATSGGTVTPAPPASPTGFYACLVDDDGDGVTEDVIDTDGDGAITSADTGATDRNGDGVIDDEDGADVDGVGITAQLFFTGQTDTVSGIGTDNYAADTRTVARARTAPGANTNIFSSYVWSFKDLGGTYACSTGVDWDMRTDFNSISWIRNTNRQPQPITVDSSVPLTITSSPVGATGCNSRGNEGTTGQEALNSYTVTVSHTIDFADPRTFNGNVVDSNGDLDPSYNNTEVYTDHDNDSSTDLIETEAVQFLKKGGTIPIHGGFDGDGDPNGDGNYYNDPGDQQSLGKFLYDKGYAKLVNSGDDVDDPATAFEIIDTLPDGYNPDAPPTGYPEDAKILGDDERIIAFEVGHTDTSQPGFELQDNIFIVASDVFKKKFKCTSGSCVES